jgi:hypothetical protein
MLSDAARLRLRQRVSDRVQRHSGSSPVVVPLRGNGRSDRGRS